MHTRLLFLQMAIYMLVVNIHLHIILTSLQSMVVVVQQLRHPLVYVMVCLLISMMSYIVQCQPIIRLLKNQ